MYAISLHKKGLGSLIKSANQEEDSNQVSLSVINTDGAAQSGLTVYVYQGTTYSGFSAVTDETGQTAFILPDGDYRFRVDFGGTQFWSEAGSCGVPGCSAVELVVTLPVSVAVVDTDGTPLSGIHVYAFDGNTYSNHTAVTDENGQISFVLPQGDYRFRADLNGTQFWSGVENTCTLPGCTQDEVIVTKPLTVTVSSESGTPYPDLDVYVFSGTTYSGYHGKTDQAGQVQFTLPVGDYHFRADFNQVQFWSGTENTCTVPGCENDQVTLPGGSGQTQVTIDYEYDALNRLTDVTYSNGTGFHYVYDAVGNVLEYEMVINGQSTFTTYSYDAANQLLTASEGEVTWTYTYDGNGSLIQSTPGEILSAGAKRYSYNTAGFLVSVETYTSTADWEPQAEMLYDGLGNRREMTAYADEQSVTTRYTLDAGRVLAAASADNSTFYLYGMGLIGELTDNWSFPLTDGSNTQRQRTDANGLVTLTTTYTPWGDLLDVRGEGSFTYGYFGGVMDNATGLLYIGNGQYYDPSTGRFLNRSARPQQANPYVPWSGDPAGMLVAPLSLMGLLLGKKKKRGKLELVVVILVLGLSLGMSLTACNFETTTPTETVNIEITPTTPTPSATATVTATAKITPSPTPTGPPTQTPTLTATCTVTSTPMPDVLDESLLRSNIESKTETNGLRYYDWYKKLYKDRNWWWWLNGHSTFTVWDLITIVIHAELDTVGNPNYKAHEGYYIYKEAVVRAAYVWCKDRLLSPPNTPEGALNWLAAYSESGAGRINNEDNDTPEEKLLHPYESAEEITDAIRNPQAHNLQYWDRLFAYEPIGVGNIKLFESGVEKIRFEKAVEYDKREEYKYNMIYWRSGEGDPGEVIIPTGCGNKLLAGEIVLYEFMGCGSGTWPSEVPGK